MAAATEEQPDQAGVASAAEAGDDLDGEWGGRAVGAGDAPERGNPITGTEEDSRETTKRNGHCYGFDRCSGTESWSARDLALVSEYLNFRHFEPVIQKAKEACIKGGHAVADHCAEMRTMVSMGSGARRAVEDWAAPGIDQSQLRR